MYSYDFPKTAEFETCNSVRGDQVESAKEGCWYRRRAAYCVVNFKHEDIGTVWTQRNVLLN